MGLTYNRDRLCVLQLSNGDGNAHLIKFVNNKYDCPNLKALIIDEKKCKIFHYARFDIAIINKYLKITFNNIYCTKIASKIARTYTDSHGLKELCRELLNISISKQQQSSDWGADLLSNDQREYAAKDVLYLHQLRNKLNKMLTREDRMKFVNACFEFLPHRVALDLAGWDELDIFAH